MQMMRLYRAPGNRQISATGQYRPVLHCSGTLEHRATMAPNGRQLLNARPRAHTILPTAPDRGEFLTAGLPAARRKKKKEKEKRKEKSRMRKSRRRIRCRRKLLGTIPGGEGGIRYRY